MLYSSTIFHSLNDLLPIIYAQHNRIALPAYKTVQLRDWTQASISGDSTEASTEYTAKLFCCLRNGAKPKSCKKKKLLYIQLPNLVVERGNDETVELLSSSQLPSVTASVGHGSPGAPH